MIKDIAIHLTGSDEDEVRIAHAAQIGRMFDAHLTGLVSHVIPEPVAAFTTPELAAILVQIEDDAKARATEALAQVEESLERTGLPHTATLVSAYAGGLPGALANQVRTSDLFVGTRPYGDPGQRSFIEEAVLFGSGRACYFAAPKAKPTGKGLGTVFVAWKDTRESARAIAEALPFLEKAREVIVGIVEEHGAGEVYREEVSADVGRYLSRHGISADVHKIDGWGIVSDALANEARQVQADLIVMGGYGHSRFREWILGGATRDLLEAATVPVLMAH
jgi:nucleotide-binding universal stress UspA family protein